MPTLQIPDLAERSHAVGLDVAGFGGLAKLSHTELALLERGDAVRVSDATAARIGNLLGMKIPTLMGSLCEGDALAASDLDVERDAPTVVRSEPTRVAVDEDSVDPTPPFERALNDVVDASGSRFNDDDRELLAAALHHAEVPSTVGPAALPALALEWLECARSFRDARDVDPMGLCAAMATDGSRAAKLMASRAIERAAAVARSARAMARMK